MSVIHNDLLLSSDEGGYNLTKSLRFRQSASAYLNRTPASSGNRRTFTWSGWVKLGKPGAFQAFLECVGTSTPGTRSSFMINDGNVIDFFTDNTSTSRITTTQVFRDPSAWYHIILAVDTTQATNTNRVKIYINGSQVTAFTNASYPTQNLDTSFNLNSAHTIGRVYDPLYSDFYLSDINFIDGQALTPSSFGETDSVTGVWKPKAYSGTYGTNGFYLKFTDVATTSGSNAGLGKDFSGNGNYWTTNNISVTSGATYDSMKDVPTLTDTDTANYCTLNAVATNIALTNGNLVLPDGGSGFESRCAGTIGFSSGKFYFEDLIGGTYYNNQVGVYLADKAVANATLRYVLLQNGNKYDGTTQTSYGSTYTSGDIIGVAVDLDNGKIWFSINGTFQASGNPASGTNAAFTGLTGTHLPFFTGYNNGSGTSTNTVNFGQRPFAYTPPTGYKALNTYNLPDSTIVAGNKYMDATTYTATGTTQSITNAGGFKPDLVWTKSRSGVSTHLLANSISGASYYLRSDSTAAEALDTTYYQSFNSNGFTVGSGNFSNGTSIIGWQWQAGQGVTSSNTSGSITSTVSVNASAGFSIVTYTGTGTTGTVGHGLGVAPKMIILKARNQADSWLVYHAGTSTPATNTLILNSDAAVQTSSLNWNSTAPSSSVFSVYNPGSGGYSNGNGYTYVAYCWAEIAGLSKFGSYTGNGNSDGPFIYTGFRPKFVLLKASNNASSWIMIDSTRSTYNVTSLGIWPDKSNAEYTVASDIGVDFLSNGIKLRSVGGETNYYTNGSYIYAAFAENPFKNSLAR